MLFAFHVFKGVNYGEYPHHRGKCRKKQPDAVGAETDAQRVGEIKQGHVTAARKKHAKPYKCRCQRGYTDYERLFEGCKPFAHEI